MTNRVDAATCPLTATEIEIVGLLAEGLNTPQIARIMNRNLNTVRTHVRNAATKLEAHGRDDLIARARVLGIARRPSR